MLSSQMQEGLRYDILRSPAAQLYKSLCLAAKTEEKTTGRAS